MRAVPAGSMNQRPVMPNRIRVCARWPTWWRGRTCFWAAPRQILLTPEMVKTMADRPIILALANPAPEILPRLPRPRVRTASSLTGRSDYPNQVNNVLCFPYIFRGALDCGATRITDAMKLACVREIAALAKMEISDEVAEAYIGQELRFGPDYIIPKPFDSRLILRIAPAVAQAAEASGVAAHPHCGSAGIPGETEHAGDPYRLVHASRCSTRPRRRRRWPSA